MGQLKRDHHGNVLILHTPRLILRDAEPNDWQAFLQLAATPQVRRWQNYLPDPNEAAAREWVNQIILHNQAHPRSGYNLVIDLKSPFTSGIGWIGWGTPSNKTHGDCDFGYALLPSYWSQGYMTEALTMAISVMFNEMGATTIFGECARDNTASARAMQKAGFTLSTEWVDGGTAMQRYSRTRTDLDHR